MCKDSALIQGKLVEKAEELNTKNKGEYDQVWCVFDRDNVPQQDFNNAIANAERAGFKVAYSNEAFELWYVLHFEFLNTGLPRQDYIKKLTGHLKKYTKNSHQIYEQIEHLQTTAIKNAENLLQEYNPPNPESDNPSTTVHLLVKELNEFIPKAQPFNAKLTPATLLNPVKFKYLFNPILIMLT